MSRVEALEKTLFHMLAVDQGILGPQLAKRGRPVKLDRKSAKIKTQKRVKGFKGEKSPKGDNDLPFTGGGYFLNIITSVLQSGANVLHTAVASLGFTPSKEQIKKLTQRLTFALNAMVQAKKIQNSGVGRARIFFRN